MVSLPIFIILLGVMVCISNLTTVPWNIEPTGQSMATLTDDTKVTFDNPSGRTLPVRGAYEVDERYVTLNLTDEFKPIIRDPHKAKPTRMASRPSGC